MHLSLGTEYSRQKQGSWTLEGSPVFLLQPVWPKRHRAVFWWLSPGSHLSTISTAFKRRSQNNFIVDESFRLIATNSTWVCNYNILKSSLSSLWSHFFPLSQIASSSCQVIFCLIFSHIADDNLIRVIEKITHLQRLQFKLPSKKASRLEPGMVVEAQATVSEGSHWPLVIKNRHRTLP